ncbi:MAG: hypothetical protein FWE27_04875 [Defluviitaleaceae bacterium]|nr:hypothetical protein [Defluviitaleaceae bacterium]
MTNNKSASEANSFFDVALKGVELLDDEEIEFFQKQVDEGRRKQDTENATD